MSFDPSGKEVSGFCCNFHEFIYLIFTVHWLVSFWKWILCIDQLLGRILSSSHQPISKPPTCQMERKGSSKRVKVFSPIHSFRSGWQKGAEISINPTYVHLLRATLVLVYKIVWDQLFMKSCCFQFKATNWGWEVHNRCL